MPYAVLLALVASVSISNLNNDFLKIDDVNLIVNNSNLNFSLQNLVHMLTKPLIQVSDVSDYPAYYRPVLNLYYMFNKTLWGLNPVGFHLSNLLLHLLTSILVYRMGLIVFDRDNRLSLLAAAIFAVHPVHNEIIGRVATNDNLLGFFVAAAFYFYLQENRYLPLITFALALFSKESAIMLPFVLVLFELHKYRVKDAVWRLRYYGVIAIVFLGVRAAVLGLPVDVEKNTNLFESIVTVCSALATYLRLLVVPYPLKIHYPAWKFTSYFQPDLMLSVAICLIMIYLLWKFKNEAPLFPLLAGIVILLAPVVFNANNFTLAYEPVFISERQLYLSAIFFSLFVSALLHKYPNVLTGKLLIPIMLIIPLFTYINIVTTSVWRNNETLKAKFFKDYPELWFSHVNKAVALFQRGDLEAAMVECNAALPESKTDVSIQLHHKTDTHTTFKYIDMAGMPKWRQALLPYQPKYADVHLLLGYIFIEKNDVDAAIRKFRTVLAVRPHSIQARLALADIYMKKKMYREASREFRIALKDIDFNKNE
jgi:tetratricopeptide (TPR) repeat protein